jgi:hypothetical protein
MSSGYQNTTTPRFYVSYGDWWSTLGKKIQPWIKLNPYCKASTSILTTSKWQWPDLNKQESTVDVYNYDGHRTSGSEILDLRGLADCNWYGILGSTYDTEKYYFVVKHALYCHNENFEEGHPTSHHDHPNLGDSHTEGCNNLGSDRISKPGFSIVRAKDGIPLWDDMVSGHTWDDIKHLYVYGFTGTINGEVADEVGENNFSCMPFGRFYDMPYAPELSLTMSYVYDGISETTSKGGSSLSNAMYSKVPDWGEVGAWQLDGNPNYRSGRRVWDLSFNYLSDSDVMPYMNATNYTEIYLHNDIVGKVDNLFASVINRTMGGHLPFIFQPNKDNDEIDQFAICKFDMGSFNFEQVSHNVYNVKLKIKEVW